MTSKPPSLESGQQAGNEADLFRGTPYRSVRLLASSDVNESYVVAHRVTGHQFYAKLQAADLVGNKEATERMRIDAQSLGCLEHANIVSIVNAGFTADGRFYLVTEYLEGRSLADELEERGRIPFLEAIVYACDVLSALSAAHAHGIVHRDPTPRSIQVYTPPGSAPYVKLTSFRGARILSNASEHAPAPLSPATGDHVVLGVPLYVSPEMVTRGAADARSDVYSVGLLLYTMIAGRGPYDHLRTHLEVFTAQVAVIPQPLSKFAGITLPPELDRAIAKALQKDPAARFQTANEFGEALAQIARRALGMPSASDDPVDADDPQFEEVPRAIEEPSSATLDQSAGLDDAAHNSEAVLAGTLGGGVLDKRREVVALSIVFMLSAVAGAILVSGIAFFVAGRTP